LIGGVYQQLLLKKFISGIGSVTLFKISLYSLLSTLECTNAATQSIDCRLVAFFQKQWDNCPFQLVQDWQIAFVLVVIVVHFSGQ